MYDAATGFGAAVVRTGTDGTITVVYRGTDSASNGISDNHDFDQDLELGRGTLSLDTQLQDALQLFDKVRLEYPGVTIRVVGHSLGGGLAGIVAAMRGVDATIIDPAPFENQLNIEALRQASLDAIPSGNTDLTTLDVPELTAALSSDFQANKDSEYIKTVGDAIYYHYGSDIYATFFTKYTAYMHSVPKLAYGINGEVLTSDYLTGAIISKLSTPFPSEASDSQSHAEAIKSTLATLKERAIAVSPKYYTWGEVAALETMYVRSD